MASDPHANVASYALDVLDKREEREFEEHLASCERCREELAGLRESEMNALLPDINQEGLGRGLQFELFRPATRERMADFYAELPISVKITGNYHDMGAFASDVAQLPRIVTLNDIAIANDKGTLTMDATAKTFRYLDEDEVAKQRRATKDAKAKK